MIIDLNDSYKGFANGCLIWEASTSKIDLVFEHGEMLVECPSVATKSAKLDDDLASLTGDSQKHNFDFEAHRRYLEFLFFFIVEFLRLGVN